MTPKLSIELMKIAFSRCVDIVPPQATLTNDLPASQKPFQNWAFKVIVFLKIKTLNDGAKTKASFKTV